VIVHVLVAICTSQTSSRASAARPCST